MDARAIYEAVRNGARSGDGWQIEDGYAFGLRRLKPIDVGGETLFSNGLGPRFRLVEVPRDNAVFVELHKA